jgi:competence protein ComEC
MKRKSILVALLGLFVFTTLTLAQQDGKLQIHFMDVGQGDGALLISPQGEMVLFDDGALKFCDKPVAYLHELGVQKIDYHITSHYHSDHIGCCGQVLGAFPL